MAHLVKSQAPLSYPTLKRLKISLKNKDDPDSFDPQGRQFEFGDELWGFVGARNVKVDPERTFKYKTADFVRGSRDSKRLFTKEALRAGVVTPEQIVDAYINANRSLFDVRKQFKGDIDAARVLNISEDAFRASTNRLSNIEVNTIDNNIFRPIIISPEVRRAFSENAAAIGEINPLDRASDVIANLAGQMRNISLSEIDFPVFENPLVPIMQDTPATPTTLNLPSIDANIVNNPGAAGSFSNLTTEQKLRILFPTG